MNTPHRSRYDELHDRYQTLLSTKAGTRYERLAALVFKALDEQSAVVHDLKLAGDGDGVRHQIDVTIDQKGTSRRILLECKDFDISRDKIGLGIARDFRSVIEDTKVDEGWMISCVGFTKDAAAYAKSKGIKLLVLRTFQPEDMAGRIQSIHVNLEMIFPTNHEVTIGWDEEAQQAFVEQFASVSDQTDGISIHDPVYVVGPDGREQFNEFVSAVMSRELDRHVAEAEGTVVKFHAMAEGRTLQVADGAPITFHGIVGTFEIGIASHSFDVTSKRIAELLLQGFGDEDMIIFDDQLQRFAIDPETGEARPR